MNEASASSAAGGIDAPADRSTTLEELEESETTDESSDDEPVYQQIKRQRLEKEGAVLAAQAGVAKSPEPKEPSPAKPAAKKAGSSKHATANSSVTKPTENKSAELKCERKDTKETLRPAVDWASRRRTRDKRKPPRTVYAKW
jgi:hypothetical protein